MLRDRIDMAFNIALKKQDKARLSVLRLINAAIKDRDILRCSEDKQEMNDHQIQFILVTMIKQREESAHIYEKSGRFDMAKKEKIEAAAIRELLPHQFDEAEIEKVLCEALEQTKAKGVCDIRKVISWLKERYAGQMDFSKVSNNLREKLR
ncbi:GatB/YqeY domain-containing protein [Bartonella sp. F02]|uniref:GatB/YqeY domain-containing protein n=1 Tax=Bartonella sp. F02 TaxID=2967262 RepID=UPI0022A98906|nr:GatB/YqeY domain-containing protein [Bartonella sp. F02]MCZ2328691.1 GatB/YqeY domain-containing protein [Bartonella sp. F02]